MPLVEELSPAIVPFDVFPTFVGLDHCLLLDSGMDHERMGRYSYMTAQPSVVLRGRGLRTEVSSRGQISVRAGDPFEHMRRLLRSRRAPAIDGLPPFQGGIAGYWGYDLGHVVEAFPRRSQRDLDLPEWEVGLYDWVLAHDHLASRTWIIANDNTEDDRSTAQARMDWVKARLHEKAGTIPDVSSSDDRTVANFSQEGYVAAIREAKEHIAAGDIYQLNLSQRFQASLPCNTWQLYTRLRRTNPAPFAAYLDFGDLKIVSISPEQFLKLYGGSVETRPIKGTRPRGHSLERDRELAAQLVASEKDRAENVMIVDLLRNDIGRVCRVGSVTVPELCVLETHPTVHHLVSTVRGELAQGRDAVDLLRACFPGGSVTGCPKVRAMDIIEELEPTGRGVYCGAIGYIGFSGDMNTSIAIRTLLAKNDTAYFQAGGAIVADSDPWDEYQETLDKARAIREAIAAERVSRRGGQRCNSPRG